MIKKKKILAAEEMPEFQASVDAMPVENRIFVDKSLEIADYIFRLMEEQGLKQKDLADKMEKTEAEVSKILSGMHNLTLRSISKLEAALGETIVCVPPKVEIRFSMDLNFGHLKNVISSTIKKELPKMDYKEGGKIVKMQERQDSKELKSEAI